MGLLKSPKKLLQCLPFSRVICSFAMGLNGVRWLQHRYSTRFPYISVLGECLDELFVTWDLTHSVKPRHRDARGRPLFGWAYSDDCLLNFASWKDCKTGSEDIVHWFRELGLHINLGKTLVVHPDMWDECVAFFRDDVEHFGFRCKWAVKGG